MLRQPHVISSNGINHVALQDKQDHGPFILWNYYHGYLWSDDAMNQGIKDHGIDLP